MLEDLRMMGQSTKMARSTLQQVRDKIAELRARTAEQTKAKEYNFARRIQELKDAEDRERAEKRERKVRAREEARRLEQESRTEEDDEMAAVMGFGSFTSGSR